MSKTTVYSFLFLVIPIISFGQDSLKQVIPNSFTDTLELEELTLSATRWMEKPSEQTVKTVRISNREINLQNPQTAADLLAVSKEVYIQKSQQGGGSPMLRGFSTNRLLYSMDGVRLNNAIYRGGNLQNVIVLDPNAIYSTEILFGPSSTTYGSDALGGVFSFSSLQHRQQDSAFQITGKSFARFSSANQEQNYHIDFNLSKNKWSWISSLSSGNFNDLRMGSHGPSEYLNKYQVVHIGGRDSVVSSKNPLLQTPNAYQQYNIMQKLRYYVSQHWCMEFDFHHSRSSEFGRYDRFQSTDGSLPSYTKWNYGPQKWNMSRFAVYHKKKQLLYDEMQTIIAHQFYEESRITRKLNKVNEKNQVERVNAVSVNVDFQKNKAKNRIYYGIETVYNDIKSKAFSENQSTNLITNEAPRYPNSSWTSYGIYTKYSYHSSKDFILQTAVRFNITEISANFAKQLNFYPVPFSDSKLNNQSIVGSLGFKKTIRKNWFISGNLSNAFRAPNVDDLGKIFEFQTGEIVVPNTNLKPEQVYSADLNLGYKIKKLEINSSIFYSYLNNAMVRRKFSVNEKDSIFYDGLLSEVYAIQNAAYAVVYGASFSVNWKFTKKLRLTSFLNYQKGTEELEDGTISRSRHAAPFFVTNTLSFQHRSISIDFYHQFNAKVSNKNLNEEEKQKGGNYAMDASGNAYTPAFHTFNLKFYYLVNTALNLSGGIENIADLRYRTFSSGITSAGRNFILAAKINF